MRFHYAESMTAVHNLLPLAKAAEELGYDGFAIPDSLMYPKESDTKYAYTETGDRSFLENKAFIETFVLASMMGAVTSRLELTTNVMKLPVRPPLYSAKMAASIAVMTHNRFNFGVGLSVWPEDYAMMGVGWEKRGKRLDECIDIVRGLCAGGYFEYHGEFYDFAPIKINPVPDKPLPILIGGHSDAALRRAARNDGWIFAGGKLDSLAEMATKLDGFRKTVERKSEVPFRVFATAMGEVNADSVKRHEDLGVTDMCVVFRNVYEDDTQTLDQKMDDLKAFSDRMIGR